MKRSDFIIGAGTAAAALAIASRAAHAVPGQIDWYTSSDQNILDFWTNVIKPKFEAANPGVTINLVDGGDSAGLQAIADRAIAALGTSNDPQADFFEGFDSRLPVGALERINTEEHASLLAGVDRAAASLASGARDRAADQLRAVRAALDECGVQAPGSPWMEACTRQVEARNLIDLLIRV